MEGLGDEEFGIADFGFRKRPEGPGRREPGAEPRETRQEIVSPAGAKEWIGVL